MKILFSLSFILFLSVLTFSCKSEATTETEASTEVETTVDNADDSAFSAKRTEVVRVMDTYMNAINDATKELEDVVAASGDAVNASLSEQLESLQALQGRLNETYLKISESNPSSWSADSTAWEEIRYEVKTTISGEKADMQKGGDKIN